MKRSPWLCAAVLLAAPALARAQYGDISDLKLAKPEDAKDVEKTPPPEGAVVLFAGDGFANWEKVGGGEVGWKVTDAGAMQVTPRSGGIVSKQKFDGRFHLHVEFRVPYMPDATGQGRGNSGVYVQGRYEVQVLDSYGLDSQNNDCGGIYEVATPLVNACKAPTVWQSYDIHFTAPKCADGKKVEAARITVRHNGQLIHKDVEITKDNTRAGLGGDPCSPGGIHLQDHGNPVEFRNIWVLPLSESEGACEETLEPVSLIKPFGRIDRKDPAFDKLVPEGAEIEVLAGDFKWSEGPVWFPKPGYLLFSDIPRNSIFRWSEKSGVELFMKPSGYTGSEPFTGEEPGANGLIRDPNGGLVLCQHGDRQVLRIDAHGVRTVLASHHDGKRLNSPNDAVFKSNGDLYFTDPPYGLPKRMEDPNKELDFQGVYRVNPRGELTLLTKVMSRPNGIAFSPDEKTLYVANSDPEQAIWRSFPVNEDGTLGEGKVFFDVTESVKAGVPGLPDGLKVDQKGNVFATGPGGVWVFSPDGKHIGSIVTNDRTANCNWGDDGSTLYITANDKLCRVKTTTKGLGFE